MERDETVIVMARITRRSRAPVMTDAWGGVLGVTKGLYHKFPGGFSTPPSRSRRLSAPRSAGHGGMRPVAELMFVDFMGRLLRPIYNQAAKFRYSVRWQGDHPRRDPHHVRGRAAGRGPALPVPVPLFTHIPGLKVVLPATPYDAKG